MRTFLPTLGIAVACAMTLGAQSTPPPTQSTQPQTQSTTPSKAKTQKMSSKRVTLTGCLREGDTPGTFVLANVDTSNLSGTAGQESPSTTPPATGTSGASSAAKSSVELIGSADVNLKEHVGHTVQITGMMVPQGKGPMKEKTSTTGTAGSATGETASEAPKTGDEENMPRLNVRSLKHVSESCSM